MYEHEIILVDHIVTLVSQKDEQGIECVVNVVAMLIQVAKPNFTYHQVLAVLLSKYPLSSGTL
jgi:hypothetical protein